MASRSPEDASSPASKRRRTGSVAFNNADQHREMGIMRQDDGRGASFVGSASGIHFVRSVYKAVGDASPQVLGSTRQEMVPGEEDQLPQASTDHDSGRLWRTSETTPAAHGQRVTFDDLVRWSQSYFDHWHPMLPFLHAPPFLDCCELISQQPLEESIKRLTSHRIVIVRAVLSTSLMDRRQMGSRRLKGAVPRSLVFESFNDAISSIQTALISVPSLESLQAAVSVQLFLISMLRHNAASRIGGLIIRLLFQMGMHRCPHRYPSFSQQECVLRQRLLWSIYCLDRYICQSLGIPLTLRDDDIDVCMLDDEQHVQDGESQTAMDPRLTLLCLNSKHSKIKGIVLELCNKTLDYRHLDLGEISRTRTAIARWANEIEAALDSIADDRLQVPDALLQLILQVLKNESIIALNRPLLTRDKDDAEYETALQACIASARSTIKLLAQHTDHTSLVWPSFTWAAWMSGFVVLYAANEREIPQTAAATLITQCATTLDRLSARGTIWPSTCAKVIRDLSKSVQSSSSQPAHLASQMVRPSGAEHSNGEAAAASQQTALPGSHEVADEIPHDFFSTLFDQQTDSIDLFRGFDIPFWLGDDQYAGMMDNSWMQ